MEQQSTDRQRMLRDALELLRIALDLLDRAAAPPQIGAHIDLAAHQLAETIDSVADETALIAVGRSAAHH